MPLSDFGIFNGQAYIGGKVFYKHVPIYYSFRLFFLFQKSIDRDLISMKS